MIYHPTMSLKIRSLSFCHYLPHLWAQLGIPLLSAITKMILRACSVAQVIMRRDRRSLPQCYSSFIVKTVPADATITLIALNISATIA
jgi:hypothetical protein